MPWDVMIPSWTFNTTDTEYHWGLDKMKVTCFLASLTASLQQSLGSEQVLYPTIILKIKNSVAIGRESWKWSANRVVWQRMDGQIFIFVDFPAPSGKCVLCPPHLWRRGVFKASITFCSHWSRDKSLCPGVFLQRVCVLPFFLHLR